MKSLAKREPVDVAGEGQCTHYECRCARANELAAMGLIVEAVDIHVHQRAVSCRHQRCQACKESGVFHTCPRGRAR